jgi:Domain of unknown function (DUF4387)
MAELWELTKLIRSKNAGPFELTFDIMFKTREGFIRTLESNILNVEAFSRIYGLPKEEIRYFVLNDLMAIKVSIPRSSFSGDPNDTDVYGGQFHSPLVRLRVEP